MSRDGDANGLLTFVGKTFEINSNTICRGSKPMEDRVELTRVHTVK